jgi:hypothetical protein
MKTKIAFKKHLTKIIALTSLSSLLIVFNQCVVQQYEEVGVAEVEESSVNLLPPLEEEDPINDETTMGGDGEFMEAGATEVARTTTSVGVKDFEQIYKTFQVLTGIDSARESSIRNDYALISSQLTNDNDLKKFSVATNIANIKLAGRFCDEMFRDSQYYNGFISFINQRANDSLVNRQANKEALADAFMSRFWGPGTQDAQEYQGNRADLVQLIDDLLMEVDTGRGDSTREVSKGVCIATLTSPRVLML